MSRHLPLIMAAFPGQMLLDIDQIATLTRYSKGHIYNLASAKKLPFKLATALGDKILVSVIEVADYLDSKLLSANAAAEQPVGNEVPQKRKPGRPRGTTVASLQLHCFQAQLKVSIYRLEFINILEELHLGIQNLDWVPEDPAVSNGDQLESLKGQVINRLAGAQAHLSALEVDLLVPLGIVG